MTNEQITDKLREIFQVILDLPPDADFMRLRRLVEPRWDSLAQTSIIAAMESEFGIELELADMERISSFEAALLLVDEKINGTDRVV
jgi:acyl carrier protein